MSNMKREFEDSTDPERDKNYMLAGLTQETIDKITKWIETASKEKND